MRLISSAATPPEFRNSATETEFLRRVSYQAFERVMSIAAVSGSRLATPNQGTPLKNFRFGSAIMFQPMMYKPKQFSLSGLQGISDKTLEVHFKLYDGYVKSVNQLNEKLAEILKNGKVDQDEFPDYSELTR